MKYERDFNGHSFEPPFPPLEEPHVELYSTRTVALFWWGAALAGALFWVAVIKGVMWAFSV